MPKTLFYTLALAALALPLKAEVSMPKIFGDNMMLQQNKPVKIWGKADANAKIRVSFSGKTADAKAAPDGSWSVQLSPLKASKNPQTMTVYENGKPAKTFQNALVGEVWLAGGQSNMEFPMVAATEFPEFKKRVAENPDKYSLIRVFKPSKSNISKTPLFDFDCPAKWMSVSEKSDYRFSSAVAIFFAERLFTELDVPVGLIITPLGGSSMTAWVPEKFLRGEPNFERELETFNKNLAKYDYQKALETFNKRVADFDESVKKAKAEGKPEPKKPYDIQPVWTPNPISPTNIRFTPAWLYYAKISPMVGYSIRGVVWYQGEANLVGDLKGSFTSRFNRLIEAWRDDWKDEKMPFIFAQLPSFGKQRGWPETRWQQFQTFKQVPNTGVVVTIDTGEKDDIHPRKKEAVGQRFARIALNKVYNKKITAYGPLPEAANFQKSKAVVKLKCATALKSKDATRGFEARVNGKWMEAKARISPKGFVEICSADGSEIDAVRYAWFDWAVPQVCLFDSEDLPAAPFVFFKE